MLLPIPAGFESHAHTGLSRRVEELEKSLDLVMELLARLAAESGSGGGGAFGAASSARPSALDALRALDLEAASASASADVAEVARLIAEGKQSTAVRRYRELSGATWDAAGAAVGYWALAPKIAADDLRVVLASKRRRERLQALRGGAADGAPGSA